MHFGRRRDIHSRKEIEAAAVFRLANIDFGESLAREKLVELGNQFQCRNAALDPKYGAFNASVDELLRDGALIVGPGRNSVCRRRSGFLEGFFKFPRQLQLIERKGGSGTGGRDCERRQKSPYEQIEA